MKLNAEEKIILMQFLKQQIRIHKYIVKELLNKKAASDKDEIIVKALKSLYKELYYEDRKTDAKKQ